MHIEFEVQNQVIAPKPLERPLVAHTAEIVTCSFALDSEWEQLNKTVVFTVSQLGREDVSASCAWAELVAVPSQVLLPGKLRVTLIGVDQAKRLVTEEMEPLTVLPAGALAGLQGQEQGLTLWGVLQSQTEALRQDLATVEQSLWQTGDNLLDLTGALPGRLDMTTGSFQPGNTAWLTTVFLPLKPGHCLFASAKEVTGPVCQPICFYDREKQFISGAVLSADAPLDIPAQAGFFRATLEAVTQQAMLAYDEVTGYVPYTRQIIALATQEDVDQRLTPVEQQLAALTEAAEQWPAGTEALEQLLFHAAHKEESVGVLTSGAYFSATTMAPSAGDLGQYILWDVAEGVSMVKLSGFAMANKNVPLYLLLDSQGSLIAQADIPTDNTRVVDQYLRLPENAATIIVNGQSTNPAALSAVYLADTTAALSALEEETSAIAPLAEKTDGLAKEVSAAKNGWVNYDLEPRRNGRRSLLIPTLYRGTIDEATGEATEDTASAQVYTELFSKTGLLYILLSATGFRRRLYRYDAQTLALSDSGQWTGETYDRTLEVPAAETGYMYRLAFTGSAMTAAEDVIGFIHQNVRIYDGVYTDPSVALGENISGLEANALRACGGEIADYLEEEYAATLQTLQALASPRTFSFAFMTDLHFSNKGSGYNEDLLRTGVLNALQVTKRLSHEFPLSLVVLGGDYMQFPSMDQGMTLQDGIDNLMEINRWVSSMACPHIALAGNHEIGYATGGSAAVSAGTDYGLTEEQIYCYLGKMYANGQFQKASQTVYYRKDEDNGVMWVCFAGAELAYNQEDMDAVAEANTEQYPMICFNHYGINVEGMVFPAVETAIEYLTETRGQEVIAWICGHCHGDWCVEVGNTPVISCLQSGRWTSSPSQDGVTYEHEEGAATESAMSVFTVNPVNKKIYCTRFGLGVDREWTYA